MEAAQIIAGCQYFGGLSEANQAKLARACERECYRKGELVFHEGQPVTAVYLVSSGCIQLIRMAPNGREVVIKTCEAGEIFAEAALLKGGTYPVTANVVQDSVLFRIPKAHFMDLLRLDGFRTDFEIGLMMRVRYLTERIAYLSGYEPAERFLHFLREHYGAQDTYHIHISKKDIAGEIGVTPEAFSRMIRRLTDEGIIEWHGDTLHVRSEG
ncbi:MAG: Crp/Fnr family transcriptional regulator [Kiritimatiellia bacterium]